MASVELNQVGFESVYLFCFKDDDGEYCGEIAFHDEDKLQASVVWKKAAPGDKMGDVLKAVRDAVLSHGR
jgi:hypothetical protein